MSVVSEPDRFGVLLRGGARGVVAAMAMTGMRTVSSGLGLLKQAPPEEVATEGLPCLFSRIPAENRDEVIELAHWLYGAGAGAVFGMLPAPIRRHAWAGPAYGIAIWLAFEAGIAPLLGLRERELDASDRLMVAADHVLYGLVLGARPRRV
jgi:hypothetical protein